jgi:hypothetical protein
VIFTTVGFEGVVNGSNPVLSRQENFISFAEKKKTDKYKRMKQDDSKLGPSKLKGKVTPFTGWLKVYRLVKNTGR